jgi:type II secretory pathway predicted ATPase ExeA
VPTEEISPAVRRVEAFGTTTDARLVWRADQYDEALRVLRAAVLDERNRLLILTGDPGTGKTLLSRVLGDELGVANVRVGRLLYPDLEGIEFVRGIAQAFGQPITFKTERGFLNHMGRFVTTAHAQGRRVLLIVDEAHTLAPDALSKVCMLLAQGGDGDAGRPCVLLVGQTELRTNLSLQGMAPDATCHLWPLTLEQSEQYIDHRLQVAGTGSPLFTPTAVYRVCIASDGIPRVINAICHDALAKALTRNAAVVDEATIERSVRDLDLVTKRNDATPPDADDPTSRHDENPASPLRALVAGSLVALSCFVVLHGLWLDRSQSTEIGHAVTTPGWTAARLSEINEGRRPPEPTVVPNAESALRVPPLRLSATAPGERQRITPAKRPSPPPGSTSALVPLAPRDVPLSQRHDEGDIIDWLLKEYQPRTKSLD